MHWIYAHLIGDFLLQTDWMAREKKRSSWACLVHVLTYMIPFLFTPLAWWQLLLVGAQHFVQDRTDLVVWFMEKTGKREFTKPPSAPWSVILVDSILHILFIALIEALGK
ncbi:MAG: DUF3307 domain-containing protein [Deferribacteres bacterium]|nr:DUF3307 domain-containing protein [candidate division KSB1 bacterium]MCB9510225.1 DUF3307 domain-containing protein [Deferribacteres bacterium]